MDRFASFIRRISTWGMGLGSLFLILMMALIVANIIYRLFGHVIPGSYELSELLIVVAASFAIGYAALQGSHVLVKIVVSRFPQRAHALVSAIMSLICLCVWAAVAWTSVSILSERWLEETTSILEVPVLPVRFVWLFGLLLLCLVYLMHMFSAIKELIKK